MMQVRSWQEKEILGKEIKSCDNHGLGEIKNLDSMYIVTDKASRIIRIPKSAIATFDGDKVWLRATEAEVLAGIYPFTPVAFPELEQEEAKRADLEKNRSATESYATSVQRTP